MKRSGRKKKMSLWIKLPLTIILIGILAIGGYAVYLYQSTQSLVNDDMHNPVDTTDTALTNKKLKQSAPINVLLIRIDAEESQHERSDAIMVMQLNPKTDEMTIVSIPRDTRTEIVGKGELDKITHAFAFGAADCGPSCGASMSIATVENLL